MRLRHGERVTLKRAGKTLRKHLHRALPRGAHCPRDGGRSGGCGETAWWAREQAWKATNCFAI